VPGSIGADGSGTIAATVGPGRSSDGRSAHASGPVSQSVKQHLSRARRRLAVKLGTLVLDLEVETP
jgi:hypothetical protein